MDKFIKIFKTITLIGIWVWICYELIFSTHNNKKYPIKVLCVYKTELGVHTDQIECDSIKGDTLWRDKNKIVNKNIVNIEFN